MFSLAGDATLSSINLSRVGGDKRIPEVLRSDNQH